jgi:hypothetical protein
MPSKSKAVQFDETAEEGEEKEVVRMQMDKCRFFRQKYPKGECECVCVCVCVCVLSSEWVYEVGAVCQLR